MAVEKSINNSKNIVENLINYITANIYFVDNSILIYINGCKNINNENYNSFIKFLEDYNYILKSHNLNISFYDTHNNKMINSNDFIKFKNYLEKHINYENNQKNDEEIIIGIPTNLKEKKR